MVTWRVKSRRSLRRQIAARARSATPDSTTDAPGAAALVESDPNSGKDNQLWRIIPRTLIDTTP